MCKNESIIYKRISQLCIDSKISINELEKTLGFGAGVIGKWRTVRATADKLSKVAQYFGVTTDFLIGISNTPSSAESIINDEDIISIQRARKNMSPESKQKMMDILKLAFSEEFKETDKKD